MSKKSKTGALLCSNIKLITGGITVAITTDWHIHTKYSCDGACMEFEDLIKDAKQIGITDFGVSDHYHSRIQEADIKASRNAYERALEKYPELNGHFHFGIEASVMSEWEINKIKTGDYSELPVYGIRVGGPKNSPAVYDFDDELIEKYNIEYVIGGVHWLLYCDSDKESVIKEQHRQYMFCITNPYTTILAHYLWFNPADLDRWPKMRNPCEHFFVISEEMRSELVHALKENNVAFEINSEFFKNKYSDTFRDEYLGWISDIQKSGVVLSFGGDSHSKNLSQNCNYDKIEQAFKHYGIDSSKFFCL